MVEKRSILLVSVLALLAFPSGVGANARFAGNWTRTSMRMTVTLDSWGENCGPQPKGYSSNAPRPVEIVSQGSHLVFSNGGLRTDRCHSPNPRLQVKSENVTSTSWSRVCETSPDDPKFERGEYVLTASGNDQLDYTAKTKVDWTLKGDHCVAHLTERRVYQRVAADGSTPPAADKGSKKPAATASEPDEPVQPGCENPGEMRKLIALPKEITIGPGEKVCLRAYGVDADGCRFPVTASSWTASQGGQEVGGLVSRIGCFTAGENAAQSEGAYTVTARLDGKTAEATVTVAFPDLGDLLRARLDPSKELEDQAGRESDIAQAGATGAPAAPVGPIDVRPVQSSGSVVVIVVVAAAGLLLVAAVLLVVLVLRRRAANREPDDDWSDTPADPGPSKPLARDLGPSSEAPPAPKRQEEPVAAGSPAAMMVCPKCRETYPPGARFCPADAAALVPLRESGKAASNEGMICPKCHRGYDPGAKFCPHDAEKLVSYPMWRSERRGG